MHQEFAGAGLLMSELARGRIRADMHALQEDLAVALDPRVAVAQVHVMAAE